MIAKIIAELLQTFRNIIKGESKRTSLAKLLVYKYLSPVVKKVQCQPTKITINYGAGHENIKCF